MNENGKLYTIEGDTNDENVFIEKWFNGYNVYLSKFNEEQNWFIGINKSGKGKWGRKTALNKKSVQFLPIRTPPEGV